ncbi:MAG: SDR family NAD(P)-dependent oxidoreductase [Myxococcota bacterium]
MAASAAEGLRVSLDTSLLERFARASGDRNPLHTSREFARRSAFGEPVAFGMLGVLVCLSALPRAPGRMLVRLSCRFPQPLFPNLEHALELRERGSERYALRLLDGRRAVARLEIERGPLRTRRVSLGRRADRLREPRDPPDAAFVEPVERSGCYLPDRDALADLLAGWGLEERGLPIAQAAALCWSSYLVGMELPGRRALYSRLDLEFDATCPATLAALDWSARSEALDSRFSLLRIAARLASGGEPFATLRLESFVRPEVRATAPSRPTGSGRSPLREVTGLVTGASRGLGAALALELLARGARTYLGYRHSDAAAREVLRAASDLEGSAALCKGDVCDAGWCARVLEQIRSDGPGLDLLVCNAAPALRPLWLEPESLSRLEDHVAAHLSGVATPLAALLPELSARGGRVVVISSAASARPVREWPHYVAAKRAIEGLVEVAALEYPSVQFWIVQPPRLRTDLTNTPVGWEDARSAQVEAARIVSRLSAPVDPGAVHWIGPDL